MNMYKILITGGAGYIGCVLTNLLLNKGFFVYSMDNLKHSKKKNFKKFKEDKNFIFHACDINNIKKTEKFFKNNRVDYVVHLAGIVGDPASKLQKKLTKLTNLTSSKKLFSLCEKYNVKKFIFASTCSNYGIVNSKKLADEKTKLRPLSLYAKTKVDFEKFMINQVNKVSMQSLIMRFSTVFGVSDRMRFDLTINQFTRELYKKKSLNIFGENTWRPYCHIKDVSRAILSGFNVNKKLEIFNVGNSKQNYSKKFVINTIGKYLKLKNITYSKQNIEDKRDYKVNFNKIKKNLKFKTLYDLDYGIKETIKLLKKNKKINYYTKDYSNS